MSKKMFVFDDDGKNVSYVDENGKMNPMSEESQEQMKKYAEGLSAKEAIQKEKQAAQEQLESAKNPIEKKLAQQRLAAAEKEERMQNKEEKALNKKLADKLKKQKPSLLGSLGKEKTEDPVLGSFFAFFNGYKEGKEYAEKRAEAKQACTIDDSQIGSLAKAKEIKDPQQRKEFLEGEGIQTQTVQVKDSMIINEPSIKEGNIRILVAENEKGEQKYAAFSSDKEFKEALEKEEFKKDYFGKDVKTHNYDMAAGDFAKVAVKLTTAESCIDCLLQNNAKEINTKDFGEALAEQEQKQKTEQKQETPSESNKQESEALAEQKKEKILKKIDWKSLALFGITQESLKKTGDLEKILNGQRSSLVKVEMKNKKGFTVTGQYKISLRQDKNGKIEIAMHGVQKELNVREQYMGDSLNEKERKQLKEKGKLERTIKGTDGTEYLAYVDKETKEVCLKNINKIQIPDVIMGTQVSNENKEALKKGKSVNMELTNESGKKYKGKVSLEPESGKLSVGKAETKKSHKKGMSI